MARTIFDFKARANDGTEVALKSYEGKALLIVNTASKCGFTPQYEGLEALNRKYRDKGLVVIGFPCDQFGHQEPGDDAQIASFCALNYGVTFPMFAKVKTKGDGQSSVFAFLSAKHPKPRWNFYKYLIGRDGEVADYFVSITSPDSKRLRRAIDRALG